MNSDVLRLVYSDGSNCSQRVRWVLDYKQISYNMLMYEHLDQLELQKLSPFLKVPALIINGRPLAESMAIIEWIEENFKQYPLFQAICIQKQKFVRLQKWSMERFMLLSAQMFLHFLIRLFLLRECKMNEGDGLSLRFHFCYHFCSTSQIML